MTASRRLITAAALAAALPALLGAAPAITEVLFNVPAGPAGDASGDGTRSASGDEFVEIVNPSRSGITLTGWTISSRLSTGDPDARYGVRFTFPEFTLPPGAVALVFNGNGTAIPGPVGDAERAPPSANPRFDGAWVFDIRNTSRTRALSNAGDFLLLSDPQGRPVDCVTWGEPDPPPPANAARTAQVDKDPGGSVQRRTPTTEPVPHKEIDGRPFSPGQIP